MKTTFILTMVLAVVLTGATWAQEPEIDLAARKRTIPIIEARVRVRNAEIMQIGNDILQLHQRIDEKLDGLVGHLAAIKDSIGSRRRVGESKMDVIDALEKTVEAFQSQRAALSRDLLEGNSGIPKQIINNELHHFDKHIEMHLEQMLKISKSFTQDKNVDRYERVGGGEPDGWYDAIEVSDTWRQNQLDRTINKKQRDEVVAALKKSIDRCESLTGSLRSNLEDKDLTKTDRQVMVSELDSHLSMLQKRRGQLEALLVVPKPDTEEVSRYVAEDLEEAVRDLVEDVQRDLQMISVKHTQLHREQTNVAKLLANLEARRKWIKEYEK